MEIKKGCTRLVFLVGKWAIKIPQVTYEWRHFLQGLLANQQEVIMNTMKDPRMCPIKWYIPGGWLNVMPRCEALTDCEFDMIDMEEFWPTQYDKDHVFQVPVEHKQDSFGRYKDRVVAIDYGS